MARPRKSGLIRTGRLLDGNRDIHQRQENIQANPYRTSSESSDKQESLSQMESALNTSQADHISVARGSMRESSSSEFEVLGIANSARWIGYELYTIIDGRKIYNRIIIKRKAAE
jgi:hypothetical protein